MVNHGFRYDIPLRFILSVSSLPELKPPKSYSTRITGKISEDELESFREALIDLYKESNVTVDSFLVLVIKRLLSYFPLHFSSNLAVLQSLFY